MQLESNLRTEFSNHVYEYLKLKCTYLTCSNVSRAEYDFDEPEFDEITESAKDFISSLLVKDAKKRLSSEQALEYVAN